MRWICWFDDLRGFYRFQVSIAPLQSGEVELSPSAWFHERAVKEYAAGGGTLQVGPGDMAYPAVRAAFLAAAE